MKQSNILPLEEVLSSRGRIRILEILVKVGEINISELSRRTRLNHSSVIAHLQILKRADLVEEKIFGRIKIYRFKSETLRGRAIKSLIELWDTSFSTV
ncbi:MAG: ArsR/SmtB family transcription factor [Candidatus Asgardarchaeia archaeon]